MLYSFFPTNDKINIIDEFTGRVILDRKFDAKVWLNGRYIEAQIVNEERLKEQLGVK